mmetsp:Transcript_26761/g.107179  ORF Transcript_26761/g.107179 Transcript_26761/m.107179 type:complete len:93 (-) Transcript_26761:79-357(-)
MRTSGGWYVCSYDAVRFWKDRSVVQSASSSSSTPVWGDLDHHRFHSTLSSNFWISVLARLSKGGGKARRSWTTVPEVYCRPERDATTAGAGA